MALNNQHVSIVFCGHVSSGKSTTAGRLLYELGAIAESELEELKEVASARNAGSLCYAWAMDREKDERERLMTIFCNTQELSSRNFHYTIIDGPGHRDYIRNMITGAAQADVGLLMVSAVPTEFRQAMDTQTGQFIQHALLLSQLGVKQLIVCVNKMDTSGLGARQFNEMVSTVREELGRVGWNRDIVQNRVPILPISGYFGDNLTTKSEKMSWWSGVDVLASNGASIRVHTLLDALDHFIQAPARKTNAPLRLPISGVYKIKGVGNVLAGRVEQGVVKPGDEVIFMPTHTDAKRCEGTVSSLEMHRKPVVHAAAGDNVGINITGLDESNMPRTGNVMILKSDTTLQPVKAFTAQVQTFDIPRVKAGYSPIGVVRCGHAACRITHINWTVSNGTKVEAPDVLVSKQRAEVVFEPCQPLVVDSLNNSDGLSRIVFLEGDRIVMSGRVTSTTAK